MFASASELKPCHHILRLNGIYLVAVSGNFPAPCPLHQLSESTSYIYSGSVEYNLASNPARCAESQAVQ